MSEAQIELHDKLHRIGSALKEHTQAISRSNSRQVADLLNDILHTLEAVNEPECTITKAHMSIVLPLLAVYKSMTMEEKSGYQTIVEPWLKVMYFLLSKTTMKMAMPPQFAIELIVMLTTLLDQGSSPTNIPKPALPPSEEIKHWAVKCISEALPIKRKESLYGTPELAVAVQQEPFFLIASQVAMALLNTIRLEHNLQLRLDAINTLMQLLVDNIQDIDKMAELLPGVTSKLCLTLTQKSENANHQLVCGLLDALGELISIVLCDEMNDTLESIRSFEDIVKQHQQPSDDPQQQQPSGTKKTLRDKAWYANVKRELRLMFGQVLRLKLYPDWRTRLAFVNFSHRLLSRCSRTLDNCVQLLLDALVLHADDAYPQVSIVCRSHMRQLLASASFGNVIMPVLKDNLYQWIMKFPQYVISKDEQEKTVAMCLIIGMILLLEDQAESVLSMVLSRASDGWMTALEIDKDSLDILEEKTSERFIELGTDADTANIAPTPLYPRIRFKHIVTDMSTAKLNRLLNIIGKHCDLSSWVHHFMRYVSTESQELNDPQAAYVVHALMSGFYSSDAAAAEYDEADAWLVDNQEEESASRDKKVQLQKIAAQVLNATMEILSAAASTHMKSTALSAATTTSLDDESGHVLTVCFGLQIVGLAAYILDQDYLQEQLITILYPLLAHLGSSSVYIHTYALITLDTIALQCGLDGAKALVIDNIDYIINSISQHIAVLADNARVPLVLKALIHVGGYASIHYLDDTVEEIYDALERYSLDEWLCTQLCGVLCEVIQTLEKNIPPTTTTTTTTTASHESNVPKSPTNDTTALVSPQVLSFMQQTDSDVDEEFRSMEDIGKYFLQRQDKGLHDNLTLDQIMEQGNLPVDLPAEQDDPTDDKPVPLTHEQQMAKDIMNKASHFLTVSSPKLRSHILSLLTSGVSVLSNHPGELNKLVYAMWPSIANRFSDPENYVVLQAARLVEHIAQVSTDFLSRNFTVDLWPRFKSLLQKGVSAAQSDPASTGYSVYSLYHRTQLCLLHTLTQVAYFVPVKQDLVKEILQSTRYYYRNGEVNQQLGKACQGLYEGLATQQADTVWLYQQQPGSLLHPPDADLLDVLQVPEWVFQANTPTTMMTRSSRNHQAGTLVQFK